MSISTQITVAATAETIIITAPGALRGPMGDVTPEAQILVERAETAAAQSQSSAGQAASSAAQAGDSASQAGNSASSAAQSAAAASDSEAAAGSSASSAQASASSATSSASSASSSASAAQASAGEAQASASAADQSATAAAQSATSAQEDADATADRVARFLAPSAVEPTQRDNGQPLQVGDQWPKTTDGKVYSWSGTAWIALDSGAQELEERLSGPDGAVISGYRRASLVTAIESVSKMLGTILYSIYEFDSVVVDRPTPSDASTWDWTPAIAKAFAEIPVGGGLTFPPGTYRSSGAIRDGAIKTFALGDVKFIQTANAPVMTLRGRLGAIFNVTSAVESAYDFSGPDGVTTSVTKLSMETTPNWSVGDVIKIVADDVLSGSANVEQRAGEFATVGAIVGNDVYITHLLRDAYTLNVRARLQINDQMGVYGFSFDSVPDGDTAGWSSDLLSVINGQNCEFENLTADFGYGIFMHLQSIFHYRAEGITVKNLINDPGAGRYGYGISDKSSSFGMVIAAQFMGCRHGFTTGTSRVPTAGSVDTYRYGRTYNPKVYVSNGMGCTNAPFDAHELADSVEFHGCTASGTVRGPGSSGAGFQLRGRNPVISDCKAQQCRVGISLISSYANETSNVIITNLITKDVTSQAIINSGAAGRSIDKVTINGGSFESRGMSDLSWIDRLILNGPTFVLPPLATDFSRLISFGRGKVIGSVNFDLSKANPALTNIRCWAISSSFTDIDISSMRIIGAPISVASQAICDGQLIDAANKVTFRNVEVDRPTEGTKSAQTSIAYRWVNNQSGTSSNSLSRALTSSNQFIQTGTLYGDLSLKFTGGPFVLGSPDGGKHDGQLMRIINSGTAALTLPVGATVNLSSDRVIPAKSGLTLCWDGSIWNPAA